MLSDNNSVLIIKLKLIVMSTILFIIDEIKDLYIRVYGESPDKAVQVSWTERSVDELMELKYELISELD